MAEITIVMTEITIAMMEITIVQLYDPFNLLFYLKIGRGAKLLILLFFISRHFTQP
jgi:hypothetical protein